MILKQSGQKTALNLFDVADSSQKETTLSKILAYLMSNELVAFEGVLNALHIDLAGSTVATAWDTSKISIEKTYTATELNNEGRGGRTDIEIEFNDGKQDFHIIIECKTKSGKATIEQYQLYKPIFEGKRHAKCVFAYLSHQSGINLLGDCDEITVVDLTWRDLINFLFQQANEPNNPRSELNDFLEYYERSYGTTRQKEILVQDLGNGTEIRRLQDCVYRRDKVNGSPLYFAPYITNKGARNGPYPAGLCQISKILGIITTQHDKMVWTNIEASCNNFLSNLQEYRRQPLMEKWKRAIELGEHGNATGQLTYYFLDEPTVISPALRKDNIQGEGRGQGWIAAMIPKNRTITFADLLEQINKQKSKETEL